MLQLYMRDSGRAVGGTVWSTIGQVWATYSNVHVSRGTTNVQVGAVFTMDLPYFRRFSLPTGSPLCLHHPLGQ